MTAEEEEEAKIPEEEQPRLENGENAEDNESGSTDSGQENSGESRLLRSGTYSDRTESKAYGSVTHKCEVRLVPAPMVALVPQGHRVPLSLSVPRTAGRSSPTLGISSGTSASTRARSPSPAGSVTKPSPTRPHAKPTRRLTGTGAATGRRRAWRGCGGWVRAGGRGWCWSSSHRGLSTEGMEAPSCSLGWDWPWEGLKSVAFATKGQIPMKSVGVSRRK